MAFQEVMLTIIGTVGGSGLLVVGLSSWLGKIWASRIEIATRASYEKEIKRLESSLELSLAQQVRNSDARFELYSEVWTQLIDLLSAGDRLWESASKGNLESFISLVDRAQLATNRGRLILREDHYQQLQGAFQSFESYEIGKRHLVNLRFPGAIDELYADFNEQQIVDQIQQNAESKGRYEDLSVEILGEFRQQLGLTA